MVVNGGRSARQHRGCVHDGEVRGEGRCPWTQLRKLLILSFRPTLCTVAHRTMPPRRPGARRCQRGQTSWRGGRGRFGTQLVDCRGDGLPHRGRVLPQHKSSLRTVAVRYRRRVLTVRTPDVFRLIYAMLDPMVRGSRQTVRESAAKIDNMHGAAKSPVSPRSSY